MIIQDATIASIWKRGSEDLDLLGEEERVQLDFLLVDLFWAHATIFLTARAPEKSVSADVVQSVSMDVW